MMQLWIGFGLGASAMLGLILVGIGVLAWLGVRDVRKVRRDREHGRKPRPRWLGVG